MTLESIHKLLHTLETELSGEGINLIETHISWVITTNEFVYKIKKPIKYSFLDYSTLRLRKFYCERELTLNRRLTQGMYLSIVCIRQKGDRVFIDIKAGRVIDYAVKMTRLKSVLQMNLMLENDDVHTENIESLATVISQFHKDAEIVKPSFSVYNFKEKFNDLLTVKNYLAQNLGDHARWIIDRAIASADTFVEEHEDTFGQRIEMGFVRDVHGDLHSKNIFLYEEPVIFDCIEFNDDYRRIDVLNEIAFFCMDLDAYDKRDLSEYFLNTYLKRLPVMNGRRDANLFNYYKGYRSNVRAKVNALRAMQAKDSLERRRWLLESDRYLRLMNEYLS